MGDATNAIAGSSNNNRGTYHFEFLNWFVSYPSFVLAGENEESSTCKPYSLRHVLEEKGVASTSANYKDFDQMSSELDSDKERTVRELEDFLEDSDCSVKDRDYVPDNSGVSISETSSEESQDGNNLNKYL